MITWDNVIIPTLNTTTVITPTLITPTIITSTLNTSIVTDSLCNSDDFTQVMLLQCEKKKLQLQMKTLLVHTKKFWV